MNDTELDEILANNNLCKCGTKKDSPNFAYHVCSSHSFKVALLAWRDKAVLEARKQELKTIIKLSEKGAKFDPWHSIGGLNRHCKSRIKELEKSNE